MASIPRHIPTREEVLVATRKSQEAMIAAVRTWSETARTAAQEPPEPNGASGYPSVAVTVG